MKKLLFLFLIVPSFYSLADSSNWVSFQKGTLTSSDSSSRLAVNTDKGTEYKRQITQETLDATCTDLKAQAQGLLPSLITAVHGTYNYPDSSFKVVSGDCVTNGAARVQDTSFSIDTSLTYDFQILQPTNDTGASCSANSPTTGTFNNVYSDGTDQYINFNGCKYKANGVIACVKNTICSATWSPTGQKGDDNYDESSLVTDNSGGNSDNGSSNTGDGSTSGTTKATIQQAIEDSSPKLNSDLKNTFTEKYEYDTEKAKNDSDVDSSFNAITGAVDSGISGLGRFGDPTSANGQYGSEKSPYDSVGSLVTSNFGTEETPGNLWDTIVGPDSIFPSIPSGETCQDFVMFAGEIYQMTITCDRLNYIRLVLDWVMYFYASFYCLQIIGAVIKEI